jgi:hypothetical protein
LYIEKFITCVSDQVVFHIYFWSRGSWWTYLRLNHYDAALYNALQLRKLVVKLPTPNGFAKFTRKTLLDTKAEAFFFPLKRFVLLDLRWILQLDINKQLYYTALFLWSSGLIFWGDSTKPLNCSAYLTKKFDVNFPHIRCHFTGTFFILLLSWKEGRRVHQTCHYIATEVLWSNHRHGAKK